MLSTHKTANPKVKPKVEKPHSAEAEYRPKVIDSPHSEPNPNPKPTFGRPLRQESCLYCLRYRRYRGVTTYAYTVPVTAIFPYRTCAHPRYQRGNFKIFVPIIVVFTAAMSPMQFCTNNANERAYSRKAVYRGRFNNANSERWFNKHKTSQTGRLRR